jgi:hypothetical protein
VIPPLWDGHAARRVVDCIEAFLEQDVKLLAAVAH